jgi:hypothetical protein
MKQLLTPGTVPVQIRLGLGGADLADHFAVRVKKYKTRDSVGCDLQHNPLSSVPIHERDARCSFFVGADENASPCARRVAIR